MEYRTISEIYQANEKIRAELKETLACVSNEQASARPEGENWSISEIAEHVSMVGASAYRICLKLLAKAEAAGQPARRDTALGSFAAKAGSIHGLKLEAPEIVRPTGSKTISDSLAALDEVRQGFQDLMPRFEKFDASAATFPHPYFGDMTAVEWLVLCGAHENRHLKQIERIIEKLPGPNPQQ